MLEEAIYHKPETEYSFAKETDRIALRLRTAKEDRLQVSVVYGGKYDFAKNCHIAAMRPSYTDRLYKYYTIDLKLEDSRLVYVFEIQERGKKYYFSEDGLTDTYDFTLNYYNAFQVAYINEADVHRKVKWLDNACFYQIFVDRFNRGDFQKDDAYINLKWGEKPTPKSFAGGDLKGILKKLGYLKELGINALYLTPIFQSVSNHKYDTRDYYRVDETFGSNGDFKELVDRCHEEGIRVVLDAVFNHVSEKCAQFRDVLKKGRESEYFDWFIVRGDKIDAKKENYECFASCAYMPKWNTSNEEVQNYLIDIALYWTKAYHIDGWRLDVSDEVSHSFWRKFRAAVKKANPDCVIIGENWHNANAYLHGDQYDSIMNYAFTKASLDFFAHGVFTAKDFAEKLNELLMRNTDPVNEMMLNLLDSHDTHRFYTQVGEDKTRLGSALAVLYMYVGVPCIYYGTETAMAGGYDPDCRRTMDWTAAEEGGGIQALVKKLTEIKRTQPAVWGNGIKIYSQDEVFYLEREGEGRKLRLSLNGGEKVLPIKRNICTNAGDGLGKFRFMIEIL